MYTIHNLGPLCFARYDPNELRFPPVNHLYYEMLAEVNEFISRKDWEKNDNKNDEDSEKEDLTIVSI